MIGIAKDYTVVYEGNPVEVGEIESLLLLGMPSEKRGMAILRKFSECN